MLKMWPRLSYDNSTIHVHETVSLGMSNSDVPLPISLRLKQRSLDCLLGFKFFSPPVLTSHHQFIEKKQCRLKVFKIKLEPFSESLDQEMVIIK